MTPLSFVLVCVLRVVSAAVVRLPLEHQHLHQSEPALAPAARDSNQNVLISAPTHGGLPMLGLGNNQYIVNISIGTPAQPVRLAVSTDDSETWVLGENCRSDLCLRHNRYHASASSSYKHHGAEFERISEWGWARGVVSEDVISLGNASASQTLGEVSDVSPQFNGARFDGVLGLGFGKNGSTSFVERVSQSGLLDEPLYSLYLAASPLTSPAEPTNPPATNTSELMLGGINKSLFRGKLVDLPLRKGARHWDVDLDAFEFNSSVLEPTGLHVRFDAFSTYIGLPSNIMAYLSAQLPPAGPDLCVLREKLPDLVFKMGGKKFALSPYEYTWEYYNTCFPLFGSNDHRLDERPRIDLGMSFLRLWYSVYNFEKRTVSLGRAVQGEGGD